MKKWEYYMIKDKPFDGKIEQDLPAMGEDGWELVTVICVQDNGTTIARFAYFKRPMEG